MSGDGTPLDRRLWALFLAGPVLWSVHFVAVYLLAEGTCALGDPERRVLGLPWLVTVTIAATVVAVAGTAVTTVAAYRRWRMTTERADDWLAGSDLNPGLALAGFLLGLLFITAILFVGIPAAFLEPC